MIQRCYGGLLSFILLLPLVYVAIHVYQFGWQWGDFLGQPDLWRAVQGSVVLVFAVVLLSCVLALPAALLLEKTDLPWRSFWNMCFVLPMAIPSFAGSFALISALGPKGSLVANLLKLESLPSIYGLPGAVLGISLFTFPYIFLAAQVALRSMSPNLDEVALTMGVKRRYLVLRLWLPYLKKPVLAGVLLVGFYALSDFGTPTLMRYTSLTQEIYLAYSAYFDRQYAAVLNVILVGIALVFLWFERRYRGRTQHLECDRDMRRKAYRISLGRYRYLAWLWCGLVVMLSLVIPVGVMLYWLSQGVERVCVLSVLQRLLPSMGVAAGVACLITCVMYPVAYWVQRKDGYWKHVEGCVYVGSAIPGLVIALALIFLSRFLPASFYQSYGLLLVGYLILFGVKSFVVLRSAVAEVSVRLEEAARTLGVNEWGAFKYVTFPLTRTALGASFILIFVAVIKELPITLLLAPMGYQSLATHIWMSTEEAFFAEAALSSLLLLGMAGLAMMMILRQQKRTA